MKTFFLAWLEKVSRPWFVHFQAIPSLISSGKAARLCSPRPSLPGPVQCSQAPQPEFIAPSWAALLSPLFGCLLTWLISLTTERVCFPPYWELKGKNPVFLSDHPGPYRVSHSTKLKQASQYGGKGPISGRRQTWLLIQAPPPTWCGPWGNMYSLFSCII